MKRICVVLVFAIIGLTLSAQENAGTLCVTAVQPEGTAYSEDARNNLETKMQRIIQNGGLLSGDGSRFVMTSKIDMTEQTITSKGMFLRKMEITFFILDVIENKVFGMSNVNAVGVGETETKALIKAFQSIQPTNPVLTGFITSAKNNILTYFENETPRIISDAQFKAMQGDYDGAYTMLMTVPSLCREEYDQCRTKAVEIYEMQKEQQKEAIDRDGRILIQKAQSVWAGKQDYETACTALNILEKVDPDAQCRADADELVNTISNKLRTIEKDKMDLEQQRHKEQWEFNLQQHKDRMSIENRKMDALNTLTDRFGKIDFNVQKNKTRTYRFGLAE